MTVFRTRSLRRRWPWLSWLGYVAFLVIVFETRSYLAKHPDVNVFQVFYSSSYSLGVLRPGQYHEVGSTSPVTDRPAEYDSMGRDHDLSNEQFYLGGTLTLTSIKPGSPNFSHPEPFIFDPYPAYNSRAWKRKFHGHFKPCLGPRGRDLDRRLPEDMMQVYKGNQQGFPIPGFGSHEAIGVDGNVCADRYSRLGLYGYDDDEEYEVPGFTRQEPVLWSHVDWYALQSLCFERNADRYDPESAEIHYLSKGPLSIELRDPPRKIWHPEPLPVAGVKQFQSRSAVVIRAWSDMVWTADTREYLRALIMELALHSGGEYQVFLLVHVKDDDIPIFSDPRATTRLKNSIPAEFRNIALFFNNKVLEAWYPKIEEHAPKFQHHQPFLIFSQLYPQFDYYWQFELDGRQTGHTYHFLDRCISFAREQPRKYLWERNAYFYTPGAHGNWSEFMQMVHDSLADRPEKTVWGPPSGTGILSLGPDPPVPHPNDDNYTWGVGEEADFITFLPIFNPQATSWTFPDEIWNFEQGNDTPRRAAVITMGRYSKRLLNLIHDSLAGEGLGLVSEMTGASWAFYHGLKAVHIPHPIYADGEWTPEELARIYNPGEPENINGGEDSIWNFDHLYDHIMYRLSYMFTTYTAEDLYRRWLGYRTAEGEGGKKSEENHYGRHCFPPMFLHTVKNTAEELGLDRAGP